MKGLSLLAAIVIMTGCASGMRNNLDDILGSSIYIPEDMSYVAGMSGDNIHEAQIKLIQCYTSEDCSTCKVAALDSWLQYQGLYDELDFGMHIILRPLADKKKTQEQIGILKQQLDGKTLRYNIYVDDNDSYAAHNRMVADNTLFSTILLDKTNNVVMVGNPVSNPKINELFMKTIANMLANDGVYVPEK